MRWICGGILVLCLVVYGLTTWQKKNHIYKQAYSLYSYGLLEKDTFLKNKAFNGSLEVLLSSTSEFPEKHALMGANLVLLRQYPLAVFYFLEALKGDPDNEEILQHLKEAIQIGGLPTVLPERFSFGLSHRVIRIVFLIWFLSLSIWIGTESKNAKRASFVSTLLVVIFTGYLIGSYYLSPIQGIILHSQILYQFPNSSAPAVSPNPLAPGLLVSVLNVQDQGYWIKVKSQEGVMGYVPEMSLRMGL